MKLSTKKKMILTASLAGFAAPALAHTAHGLVSGFVSGGAHPLGGLDHLLIMLAVGLWATQFGNPVLWRMPLAFLAMMMVGAMLAAWDIPLPAAETAVELSLIIMGVLLWSRHRLKAFPAASVAGLFALFHGYVHAYEITADSNGLAYGLGFLATTAALHAGGILLGVIASRWREAGIFRAFGVFCSTVGIYLLTTG